ncbi:hypothetical protein [Bradyrhizobium valentinum]|uniref:hypothetical protein n=1 Tax=Bradyrhizobium valentinum TaxID=1518501 RepID=UPI000A9935C7|nr:hypothetical protein [Bradyrhizobium valentinum]
MIDVINSLSMPSTTNSFDMLITRELALSDPPDLWEFYNEQLVSRRSAATRRRTWTCRATAIPLLTVTS